MQHTRALVILSAHSVWASAAANLIYKNKLIRSAANKQQMSTLINPQDREGDHFMYHLSYMEIVVLQIQC
jgi:hypothetical protein